MESDAHSALAAIAPSAAWRLVHALVTLHDAGGEIRIPGFYDRLRGPNDAELEAIAVQGDAMEAEARMTYGFRGTLDDVTGPSYVNASPSLRRRTSQAFTAGTKAPE